MKKLLTLALVGAMLTATGITAFAETTNVSYNVDPSYTVAIPADVTLGDAAVTADITASDVILEDGKQIKVDLTAASNTASGSTFNAKNGDSAVTYTITGDKAIAVGDTVATFTANGSKTLTFSAANKSAATVAGSHTETLTFGISVENAAQANPYADQLSNGYLVTQAIIDNYWWLGNITDQAGLSNSGFGEWKIINITEAEARALAEYKGAGSVILFSVEEKLEEVYGNMKLVPYVKCVKYDGTSCTVTELNWFDTDLHEDPLIFLNATIYGVMPA